MKRRIIGVTVGTPLSPKKIKEKIDPELTSAINTALAQAKASGEFDGTDGKDGYTPVKGVDYFDGKNGTDGKNGVDGKTPVKGVDYFDGKDGQNGKDGYTPVKGVDYFDGQNGKDGQNGYTPVRGTDYWTVSDIAEIKSYVDEAILGGAW